VPTAPRMRSTLADTSIPVAKQTSKKRRAPALPESHLAHQDLLSESLAYAIKRAQVRCDEALVAHLGTGLSPARFAALCAVGSRPGMSQAALGALLGINGPSVVKVVDELERMGLVKRMPTADRRAYALELTERGDADLLRYEASTQAFEKRISGRLTASERALLQSLLAKVAIDET
jgi:DNA-binding MarR family transcriptional regulator